jgi:3-oxoacyl-[acyl-carrier-protein] synthase II
MKTITPRRVAITGAGVVSSLGNSVTELFDSLKANKSGVKHFPDWEKYTGLRSFLGAPAHDYDARLIARQHRRTMSRMSEMALIATQQALRQADIANVNDLNLMITMGSTTGSPGTFEEYFRKFQERGGPEGQLATSFFKIMNHSVASNVAMGLEFNGAQLAVASACSTSTQAAVVGWELIRAGYYDVVIAGGADELHHTSAAIFDNVHAASTRFTDRPTESPRPFDVNRDGLVVSEGAGVIVMESEEHMLKRGVKPLAFIEGGFYYCNGSHMTQPQIPGMVDTMAKALERADLKPEQIDYINAHGTGTVLGDNQEAKAINAVFGDQVPVSSIKGHLGHTLAACGTLEIIACAEMMRHQLLIPTRNLENIDPEAKCINLIQEQRATKARFILSNNFAFGGMNVSVIISSVEGN